MQQLILGGARSGKSSLAQRLAEQYSSTNSTSVTVIATGEANDDEMRQRIEHHQQERPSHWQTIEEPIQLAQALQQADTKQGVILVDCLTLWVTNLLCSPDDIIAQEFQALMAALPSINSEVIFVSNETGQGIIPLDPLSRRFVDEAGRLHQQLAQKVDRVIYCVAGLPQVLKGEPL